MLKCLHLWKIVKSLAHKRMRINVRSCYQNTQANSVRSNAQKIHKTYNDRLLDRIYREKCNNFSV